MALVGESNERPKWVPDPTSPSMRFDEERRKREEEEARKEEERKQRAIAAAQAMAAHRAEEQRTTNQPTRVSTDVSLTGPRVDTGAPSLSASSNYQGPIAAPEQPSAAPAASVRPQQQDWRRGYAAPSVAPGMAAMPDQTAGIRALGALAPSLAPLVGRGIEGTGQALTSLGQNISQGWQNLTGGGTETLPGMTSELFNQRKGQMEDVFSAFRVGADTLEKAAPGPLTSIVGGISRGLEAIQAPALLAGNEMLDKGTIAISPLGRAAGATWAAQDLALTKMAQDNGFQSVAEMPASDFYREVYAAPIGDALRSVLDPQVRAEFFDSLVDVVQYWKDSYAAYDAALIPTLEQTAANDPARIAEARQVAILQSSSGVNRMAATFDDWLDSPALGQQKIDQALALQQQAYALPEGPERDALEFKAAQLSLEGEKQKNSTLLEVYDRNTDFLRSFLVETVFSPLNFLGTIGDGLRLATGVNLTPLGRRTAKALSMIDIPEGTAVGSKTLRLGIANPPTGSLADVLVTATENAGEALKVANQANGSLAQVTAQRGIAILNNLVAPLSAKGDMITAIRQFAADPQAVVDVGINIADLLSPSAVVLKNQNNMLRVPWAGAALKEFTSVQKMLNQPNFLESLVALPSLAGDAAETINRFAFHSDLSGLLSHYAGEVFNVSAMHGVPYGAAKAVVALGATPGTSVVNYTTKAGQIIASSAEMGQGAAATLALDAGRLIERGLEYRRNPVKWTGDIMRNVMSFFNLNSTARAIINNMMGGMGVSMVNQESGLGMFRNVDEAVAWALEKSGGLPLSERIARGYLEIPAAVKGGGTVTARDYLSGSILEQIPGLGWVAKKGRELRNKNEEFMAAANWAHNYRRAFVEGWEGAEDIVRDTLAQGNVTDPQVVQNFVDQIVQAGISGNVQTVANTIADLARGKASVSLRTLAPPAADVLPGSMVTEIDGLLRNLTTDTIPAVRNRVLEIFGERTTELLDAMQQYPQFPARTYWTETDFSLDYADLVDSLRVIAQHTGDNPVYATTAKNFMAAQEEVQRGFLNLARLTAGSPENIPYLYRAWEYVQDMKTQLRATQDRLAVSIKRTIANLPATPPPGQTADQWRAYRATVEDDWWKRYAALKTQSYEIAGQKWKDYVNGVADDISSGRALQFVRLWQQTGGQIPANVPAGAAVTAPEMFTNYGGFLKTLTHDPQVVLDMFRHNVEWASDPRWVPMMEEAYATQNKFMAEMFAAFQRSPTPGALDEYMSAIRQVAKAEHPIMAEVARAGTALKQAKIGGIQSEITAAYDVLGTARQKWADWFQFSYKRYHAGALRILETGLPDTVTGQLRWTGQQMGGRQFQLVGAGLQKNFWKVLDIATGKTIEMPTGGITGVPEGIIQALGVVQKEAQRGLAESIGQIAYQAGVRGQTGFPEIDAMIQLARDVSKNDVYWWVKKNVQEQLAGMNNWSVPGNMEEFVVDSLTNGAFALTSPGFLENLAELNARGYGKFDLNLVGQLNDKLVPFFGNVAQAANKAGEEALSTSVVDFSNVYHADYLLGLGSAYHFWNTRMAKNALERMIFSPKMYGHILRSYDYTIRKNELDGQPRRNATMIPGLRWEDAQGNVHGINLPLATWIPTFPMMFMHGWADPDNANRALEYIQEGQDSEGIGGLVKVGVGYAGLANEMINQVGLSTYPWTQAGINVALGKRSEFNLGFASPLKTMGWGMNLFAKWLVDHDFPGLAEGPRLAAKFTNPFYTPYLVGRQGTFNAATGKYGEEIGPANVRAQNIQDVGRQEFFPGTEPLPEQLASAPQDYQDVLAQVSVGYLVREAINWATSLGVRTTYAGELELKRAKEQQQGMGYTPGSGFAGSKNAQTMMYDQTPGLSAYGSQYAVTGEISPQVPDPNAVRPGARAAQGAYYDKKDEIDARYAALIEAEYGKHPEWTEPGTGTARYEILNPIWKQKDAELEALKAQYPTVQEMERQPANAPSKLAGTNPNEAVGVLLSVIVTQAKETLKALDPGERPENASRSETADYNERKAQYEAALTAEVNRLMQQPDIGGLVPGRELPGAGVQAESGSLPPIQGPQYRQPGVSGTPVVPPAEITQVSQTQNVTGIGNNLPTESATIDNPWTAEMAAAEQQYGLPPGLLSHIAQAESGFDPAAKSGAGAVGLMQFMPATWGDAEKALGLTDINDPAQQVQAAAWYLDWLSKQLPPGKNGLDWQLAAYNLGIGKVSKLSSLDQLPGETAGYVNAIVSGVGEPSTPMAQAPYTPGGTQTQAFGNESDYYTSQGFAGHEGVDYGMPEGTPVTAAAAGTVVFAGEAPPNNAAYGNYIIVRHGDGKETWYAHLSGWDVKAGDTVKAGQQIGLSGNTGTSTGPHLHFAVRDPDAKGDPMKGFIDPTTYLSGMEQGLPTSVGVALTPPATAPGLPAPAPGNNIQFPKTAEQLISGAGDQYKGPLQLQSEAGLAQGRLAQDVGLMQAYPEYVGLRAEWDRTNDEDRAAFRLAHPEITAVNLLLWNKDVWTEVEQTFGQGAVMKYARRPTYESGQRATYYHKDPTAFLVGAWLNGRPEPKKEEGQQDTDFSYDRGGDFAKAEELFGAGIWGKVRSYWAIDPADKTARSQFYKDNPDYKAWNDWWYALMPDQKPTTYAGYYLGGGSGYGKFEQQDMPGQAKQSWRRSYPSPEVPVYPTGGGIGSDWRKWLDVGSRGWRG